MKQYLWRAVVILVMLMTACAGTQPSKKQAREPDVDPKHFLTAEGTGNTKGEAQRSALAALASIFQSRVRAETRSRAASYLTEEQGEAFEKQVEQLILIDTDVQLEGARIGWVRPDEQAGGYRALAVLDRVQAAGRWRNGLERSRTALQAELHSLRTVRGRLPRLIALNRITVLMGDIAVAESRLSVLGRPAMPDDTDFAAVLSERAGLVDSAGFFIRVEGDQAGSFAHQLGALLTARGYQLTQTMDAAAGLIAGKVRIQPLALDNRNAVFVRALADITLVDLDTSKEMAAFSSNVRKGHMDEAEAQRRAMDQLAEQTAAELIQTLSAAGLVQ